MDNAQTLIEYCKNNMVQSDLFSDYIRKKPCFAFLSLGNQFHEQKKIIMHLSLLQATRNKEVNDILQYLQLPFEQYVGLKGIFLHTAYWPKNLMRLFGDIDILVSNSKSLAFRDLLINKGYRLLFTHKLSIYISKEQYFQKFIHATFFKKTYPFHKGTAIELHGNINQHRKGCKPSFDIEQMIDSAITKHENDFHFRVFSPVDNILYLMYHTIKHLSYIEQLGSTISIGLQHFYDVAQIIDQEAIDWSLFTKRIGEYNLQPYVALFLKMYTDIFPGSIPTGVYEDVLNSSLALSFPWKDIFSMAIKMDAVDLILGNYRSIPIVNNAYAKTKITSSRLKRILIWRVGLFVWRIRNRHR